MLEQPHAAVGDSSDPPAGTVLIRFIFVHLGGGRSRSKFPLTRRFLTLLQLSAAAPTVAESTWYIGLMLVKSQHYMAVSRWRSSLLLTHCEHIVLVLDHLVFQNEILGGESKGLQRPHISHFLEKDKQYNVQATTCSTLHFSVFWKIANGFYLSTCASTLLFFKCYAVIK